MYRNLKIVGPLLILFASMACLCTLGCDEDDSAPKTYFQVSQERSDGTIIIWSMANKPEKNEGFVYWYTDEGLYKAVSGTIVIDEKILPEKEKLDE